MAMESQGVALYWSTSTSKSTSSTAAVGEVASFSGPTGSAAVIDVTHLGSTAKEKLMGLPDEGNLTMEVHLVATDSGQTNLRTDRASRTLRKACIELNDASSYYIEFDAYCSGFSVGGSVDDKLSASITLEIANAVTWSTG